MSSFSCSGRPRQPAVLIVRGEGPDPCGGADGGIRCWNAGPDSWRAGRGRTQARHGDAARGGHRRYEGQPGLPGGRQILHLLQEPSTRRGRDSGERYRDVIVFWVADEAEKQALVQDESTPFFSTTHFDGHPSVLVRASRLGELSLAELQEIVQDAWLARASRHRAEQWLSNHPAGGRPSAG
jgi:hypothetical protein